MFKRSRIVLPEPADVPSGVSPEPLFMKCGVAPQGLGDGVNPISGKIVATPLGGLPSIPTSPPSVSVQSAISFNLVSTTTDFVSAVAADASASGYTPVVNATFTGSYMQNTVISSFNLTAVATGLKTTGSYVLDFEVVDATPVVTAIREKGYDTFIASNGTHFIGGAVYGIQYDAVLNFTYGSMTNQTSAAAAVSVVFGSATEGGEFGGSIQSTAEQQTGYLKFGYSQQVLGGFEALPDDSVENINKNLNKFDKSTQATPIFYLLYDWRMLPGVADAAGTLSFDFDAYVNNLPGLQSAISELNYMANSSLAAVQNGSYIGQTNQQNLEQFSVIAINAIRDLQAYMPDAVAQFNSAQYMEGRDAMPQVKRITDGMYNVQISCSTDGAFYQVAMGPQVFPVFAGDPWPGFTIGKKDSTERWFFGCGLPGQGQAQPVQGLIITGGGLSPDYSYVGPVIGYDATGLNSLPTTINGVNWGNTYPWLSTTVQLV